MKAVFFTLGTRGDVQPYVALAKGLKNKGHQVVICTGETFRDFIEENGISFYPATVDLMAILESEEGRAVFAGGGFNLFKMLKYSKEVVTPAYRKTMDDFLIASQGADVIIYHPKALAAVDIAAYRNIPCISMPPVPITYPVTEFPNLAMFPRKNLGATFNKLTYRPIQLAENPYIKDINAFRKKSLGVGKRKAGELTYYSKGKEIPIVYPISPYLFRDVTSWNGHVYLPGFFYLDIKDEELDKGLRDFLAAGKKPIVITFSSMPLKDPDVFKNQLIEALISTNNRGVVLTGVSGMTFDEDEMIYAIDKAPHRLIFKEAMGIIHHGGMGTTAEALLSGTPQLIMPFSVDQPFWAHRLHDQGYALTPLDQKKLKVSDLVAAFEKMEDSEVIKKAGEIKAIVKVENGVEHGAQFIEELVQQN